MATVSIRTKLVAVVVLLLGVTALPACYTILQHPRLAQLNYRRPETGDCRSCHTRDDLWRYVHPTALPAHPAGWEDYYNAPWWNEERWRTTPPDSTQGVR